MAVPPESIQRLLEDEHLDMHVRCFREGRWQNAELSFPNFDVTVDEHAFQLQTPVALYTCGLGTALAEDAVALVCTSPYGSWSDLLCENAPLAEQKAPKFERAVYIATARYSWTACSWVLMGMQDVLPDRAWSKREGGVDAFWMVMPIADRDAVRQRRAAMTRADNTHTYQMDKPLLGLGMSAGCIHREYFRNATTENLRAARRCVREYVDHLFPAPLPAAQAVPARGQHLHELLARASSHVDACISAATGGTVKFAYTRRLSREFKLAISSVTDMERMPEAMLDHARMDVFNFMRAHVPNEVQPPQYVEDQRSLYAADGTISKRLFRGPVVDPELQQLRSMIPKLLLATVAKRAPPTTMECVSATGVQMDMPVRVSMLGTIIAILREEHDPVLVILMSSDRVDDYSVNFTYGFNDERSLVRKPGRSRQAFRLR